MMATSLFCQDHRQELGGMETLIGIVPDNINVEVHALQAGQAATLPKIVVYSRILLRQDEPRGPLSTFLRTPDGQEVVNNEVDAATLDRAYNEAAAAGNKLVTLVTRIESSPFPLLPGRYITGVRYRAEEYMTGSLNVVMVAA